MADQKGKQKTEYFKERILTGSGAKDPDVRKLMDRLFKRPVYEDLVDALGNLINYNVLNNTFQSIGERGSTFDKINTNLNLVIIYRLFFYFGFIFRTRNLVNIIFVTIIRFISIYCF